MAIGNTKEAKSLARDWMNDAGFFQKDIVPSPANLNFLLQGEGPTKIPFLVTQSSESKTKSIAVIVNVNITESSYKSLGEMSEDARKDFIWDLKKELIFAPANFLFVDDEKTGILRRAQFSKEIYFDELSEGRLAEVVDYTTRSALWLIWTFRKKFGPIPEAKPNE
ncbi:MAG: DUF2299 family protein [Methanothrix sp.]